MSQQVIGQRYEVLGRIGKGGMATVYKAKDTRLLREVAVKLLLPTGSDSEGLFYFHREARAIAALRHQNIVQIYDYSGPDENPAYIVMELIEGGNIDELLMVKHPLPEDIIASAAVCIASALQHAHEHGVIHRDIKPANVMVEKSGRLLLTDFGIAKAYRDEALLGQTVSGQQTQLFGTPDFMAPEQIMEKEVGPHTDVFALGSLIYCLATNVSPFDHEETVEILRRVVDVDYTPLRQVRPELSPELDKVIKRCLTQDIKARPTSGMVVEMCEDLLFQNRVSSSQKNIYHFLRGERPPPQKPRSGPAPRMDFEPDPITEDDGWGATTTGELTKDEGWERDDRRSTDPGQADTFESDPPPEPRRRDSAPAAPRRAAPRSPLPLIGAATAIAFLALAAVLVVRYRDTIMGASEPTITVPTLLPSGPSGGIALAPSGPDLAASGPVATGNTATGASGPAEGAPLGNGSESLINESDLAGSSEGTKNGEAEGEDAAGNGDGEWEEVEDQSGVKRKSKRKTRTAASKSKGTTKAKSAGEGTITLTVKPWGTVEVDGAKLGNTPVVRLLTLEAGKHTIAVTHPSLGTQKKTIQVKAGDNDSLVFDLRKE